MHIRIGTRGSKLALAQTKLFIEKAKSLFDFTYEIVIIKTTGDQILDRPLYDIGGKALFLKEIEEALIAREIDCAVHSMKDVPGKLPSGLIISAMLEREDPKDVLISKNACSIMELPINAQIGTSSVRRAAQIKLLRPDIQICSLRGNVPTRINQWKNSNMDGIILASAGIKRLGLYDESICHAISIEEMIPAVGQGAIAIEIRNDDDVMQNLCTKINHLPTFNAVSMERGFLEYLEGDCRTALASYAYFVNEDTIEAKYILFSEDFKIHYRASNKSTPKESYTKGVDAAELILKEKAQNTLH